MNTHFLYNWKQLLDVIKNNIPLGCQSMYILANVDRIGQQYQNNNKHTYRGATRNVEYRIVKFILCKRAANVQ